MRISDWRSDVCSSDLTRYFRLCDKDGGCTTRTLPCLWTHALRSALATGSSSPQIYKHKFVCSAMVGRSEERRVGKECVISCRSRWSPYNSKKNFLTTILKSYHDTI